MNCRTFSQNPRKRGKSQHHHHHGLECVCVCARFEVDSFAQGNSDLSSQKKASCDRDDLHNALIKS